MLSWVTVSEQSSVIVLLCYTNFITMETKDFQRQLTAVVCDYGIVIKLTFWPREGPLLSWGLDRRSWGQWPSWSRRLWSWPSQMSDRYLELEIHFILVNSYVRRGHSEPVSLILGKVSLKLVELLKVSGTKLQSCWEYTHSGVILEVTKTSPISNMVRIKDKGNQPICLWALLNITTY